MTFFQSCNHMIPSPSVESKYFWLACLKTWTWPIVITQKRTSGGKTVSFFDLTKIIGLIFQHFLGQKHVLAFHSRFGSEVVSDGRITCVVFSDGSAIEMKVFSIEWVPFYQP